MKQIYLCLGSNIGNRQQYLSQAIKLLAKNISLSRLSRIYETEPWGKTDQPMFLNLCLSGQTDLSPEELLKFIKKTEKLAGRMNDGKWGPREIDIDILFYGDRQINQSDLVIPHPNLHDRAFVLVPLEEIAADFVHPVLNIKISQLLKNLDKNGLKVYEA